MIKVYFTAATSFNGELHDLYKSIISLLKQNNVTIISGEQVADSVKLSEDKKISKTEIFNREQRLISEADCVVAEVSKPSLGVGAEIAFALQKNKPVLALMQDPKFQGVEDKLSPMIAGNPSENLFIEFYNDESLSFSIQNFLKHVLTLQKKRGRLIVMEGGDGSGKSTQTSLLIEYLKKQKIAVKYMDFPQYYPSFHGKTVAKFLRGEFGSIDQVSPYLASLAYALDRASVKEQMENFLNNGGLIIANRYATSNMAHQGAKFKTEAERETFITWIYELEYKVHKIPKEDLVIYLYVPWQIGATLIAKRGDGKYLEGKKDIHETDEQYRASVETMYLSLAEKHKHWVKIECVENGQLLSKQAIHEKIIAVLREKNYLTII